MRTIVHRGRVFYASDICPRVRTQNPREQQIIAPCDARPVLWRIVRERRSKAWGIHSPHYTFRTNYSHYVLHRAGILLNALDRSDILGFSARFTAEHYGNPALTGGDFEQYDADGEPIVTLTLDYTPDTIDDVCAEFFRFADALPGATLKLGGTVLRRLVQLPTPGVIQ